MTPHTVIYTDRLPEDVGGCANGPVVRIRPKYRDDLGLLRHEVEHVRQWWAAGLIAAVLLALVDPTLAPGGMAAHSLLYLTVRPYRLWCEVKAYRVQMQHPDSRGRFLPIERAAEFLMASRYRFGFQTRDAALEKLMNL